MVFACSLASRRALTSANSVFSARKSIGSMAPFFTFGGLPGFSGLPGFTAFSGLPGLGGVPVLVVGTAADAPVCAAGCWSSLRSSGLSLWVPGFGGLAFLLNSPIRVRVPG